MNKLITVNLSYYNQKKEVLARHLDYWNDYPSEILDKFKFNIIDDCSKINIEEILNSSNYPKLDLNLYRVCDDLYCNIGGVRNLGAKETQTPYMVILDMDTYIDKNLAKELVKLSIENIKHNTVFKFNRMVLGNKNHKKNNKPHPAICLIRKKDYWKIGGCDEDFVGHYGYTDPSFWYRSQGIIEVKTLKNLYLHYFPDGEADINRDKSYNQKLFKQKKKNNNWSNEIIRFKWYKIE